MAACGGNSAAEGSKFVKTSNAALNRVPGVVAATTEYKKVSGMGPLIRVSVEVETGSNLADMTTSTLKAFADASESVDSGIHVGFSVFESGAESTGVGPTVVGLAVSPTVAQIQEYAKHN